MARFYNTSDEFMVERSDTIQQLFSDNLAPFTLFDPELDAAFATAWQTAIDNAVAAESAETVDDQMQQLTDAVLVAMNNGRKKYVEVGYYFKLAFPKNRAVMKEMGADDYVKARNRQMRLVMFLENLHLKAEKYKTQLIAKGYTQLKIDAIDTLRQALQAANKAQNAYAKGRPVLTQDRENILNACYSFTDRVCEAANSVFYDDEVMRALFVFNPGGENGDAEIFEGTVAATATVMVDDFTYNANMRFDLQNTGTTLLTFALSLDGTTPTGTSVQVPAGETESILASEMAPAGTSLIVTNGGGTQGSYIVEESI